MFWVGLATLLVIVAYFIYLGMLMDIALPLRSGRPQAAKATGEWSFASILTDDRQDTDYALLWNTQVPALQLLRAAGDRGIPVPQLKRVYDDFTHNYPELSEGSDFPEWVACLHRSGVAAPRSSRIVITAKGLFIVEAVEQMRAAGSDPHAHHFEERS